MRSAALLAGVLGVAAWPLAAQTHLGDNFAGGLHWHVAAPAGASWSLECRFRPITRAVNQYERRRWANRLTLDGAGPQAGRLPVDNGRCTLVKRGGLGPVAIALVRGDETVTGATAAVGGQAFAGLL
jgi:hypothetical protein